MGGNGSRFPMGPPPMPGGTQIQVSAPQNDFQLVCHMAAIILAPEPVPATAEERNTQEDMAATRAVELFGHVAYRLGRGIIKATSDTAIREGQAALKEAILNERAPANPPDAPPSKIITEGL